MRLGLKLLLFLIIMVIIAIFTSQNNTPVTIKFFTYEFVDISVAIIIFGSVLVGFICGLIPASIRIVSLKHRVQRMEDYWELREKTGYNKKPGIDVPK
jgi:uncharacterized integral membrane protein